MHFATRVRTWRVARLHSEIALSRKPFGTGHTYIYTLLLRMTDTMTFQDTDLSARDTCVIYVNHVYSKSYESELEILDPPHINCSEFTS
jgi:hypothetical protein